MRTASPDEPVVVIGSGPTGAVAAARLVERGVDVVMLDSGTSAPRGIVARVSGRPLFRKRWGRTEERLTTDSGPGVQWVSSLSHGGLSNFWTAAVPRFAAADFSEGGRLDDRYVWPVAYDDLVPFYEDAERILTVTGGHDIPGLPTGVFAYEASFPRDWSKLARDVASDGHGLGPLPAARGRPSMLAIRGSEFNSYHCVVRPLQRAHNFELRSGAHVERIDTSRGRVSSVSYFDRITRQIVNQPARAVVVAAGAIDTACILLRSRSREFPSGLGNEQDLIGRYLHDHPRQWWPVQPERPMTALNHPMYLARQAHDSSEPLMAVSHTIGLASGRQRPQALSGRRVSSFGVQVFGTMVPTSERSIELSDHGLDDAPGRQVRIKLSYDEDARRNIQSATDRLRTVFGAAGLKLKIAGPFHPLEPGSSVHYGGSVRMHHDREFGVLDGFNRMHDVPSVVVVDMSCFTTGPEKNPTLTAMALAIRAAEQLARDID